jgi:YgiT-type zinc finger domain-containing protein
MTTSDFDRKWEKLAEEVLSGMKEWRIQHPRATLKEMEEALDQRLNRMRARLLEDMALASEAANLQEEGARARCPQCGEALVSRGKRKRGLQTNGGEEIVLERSYGVCPRCGVGIFPPR